MKNLIQEFQSMQWQDRVVLKASALAAMAVIWFLIVEAM